MKIAIASGKGGTGKTLVATNLARVLSGLGKEVTYLDCDVEAPNGHLFLKPSIEDEERVELLSPVGVDGEKCIKCGKCAEACTYNAIAVVKEQVIFFPELCHICGACTIVCPTDAVLEKNKEIGVVKHGKAGKIDFHYGVLKTGEGGMSPRLIKKVKESAGEGINIYDSPPGTACPVVETVKEMNLVILVTDPTPFGINDLKLAVLMCRKIGQEPVVFVNRAEYEDNSLKEYCRREGLRIIGEIPDDRKIAEVYSSGDLVVDKLPPYRSLFETIAAVVLEEASREREVRPVPEVSHRGERIEQSGHPPLPGASRPRELVVISGKGGTGKTSLTASFAFLAKKTTISDCDVDAADLHLLLQPEIEERGLFSGGVLAEIERDKCTGCGRCYEECRFNAIVKEEGEKPSFRVDPLACEGCGVCRLVCPVGAVKVEEAVNGEWFVSRTRLGQPMTHACLGVAEENSGRLVTLIREKAANIASRDPEGRILIDGSPGTGCPVIASLTGAFYALIVTEPTVSGVHDLGRILDVTRHFGVPAGVVINKADLNREMAGRIKKTAGEYGAELIGEIPYDTVVTKAQMKGLSVVEYAEGPVTDSIRKIWGVILSYLHK